MIVGASGHTIAVNKAGFEPWSKYVDAPAAGQHIPVNAIIVAIPTPTPTQTTPLPGSQKGYYLVRSDPAGARVLFDGTDNG